MAIDTAEKRRAAVAVNQFNLGVTPNASQDEEWRGQAAYSYRNFEEFIFTPADTAGGIRNMHRGLFGRR